jgi:hypothetical protein
MRRRSQGGSPKDIYVDVYIDHDPNKKLTRIKSPYVFIELLLLYYSLKDIS